MNHGGACKNTLLAFACCLVIGTRFPAQSSAQSANDAARGREMIKEDARASLHLGNEALFLVRREDLERDIIELQFAFKGRGIRRDDKAKVSMPCIEVFDISRGGYDVKNGTIAQAAVDLDDAPTWRSAYDCDGGKVFHLYGFPDGRSGFNNAVSNMKLKLDTSSDALVVLASFLSLAYSESPKAEVRDELDLMRAALADFPGPRSQRSFETYWNRCPLRIRRAVAPPKVAEVAGEFKLTFFSYVDKRVYKNTVLCRSDGTLASLQTETLFRW